ncbi:hypothetical protein [Staphylococcus epidermidis]|nr:hypothetical protein [Staphylococcus epidermidis]
MDSDTKILIAVIIYKLPELVKQLRILVFGVIDRKRKHQKRK